MGQNVLKIGAGLGHVIGPVVMFNSKDTPGDCLTPIEVGVLYLAVSFD